MDIRPLAFASSSGRAARASLIVLALVLPISSAGCAETACFQWTELEGACPAEADALPYFRNPTCPEVGEIDSVESDGVFEDDACCYTVTKSSDSFGDSCFDVGSVGKGPSSGFAVVAVTSGTSGGGFGGAGGMSGVGGAGGAGGDPICARCGEVISGGDTSNLCESSLEFFNVLIDCLCNGPCAAACSADCSSTQPMAMECQQCMGDTSMGCGNEFQTCANDI